MSLTFTFTDMCDCKSVVEGHNNIYVAGQFSILISVIMMPCFEATSNV